MTISYLPVGDGHVEVVIDDWNHVLAELDVKLHIVRSLWGKLNICLYPQYQHTFIYPQNQRTCI